MSGKITVSRINNHKVKPIAVKAIPADRIKGYDLIPELYANIFLCAQKKSGKTNVIFHLLMHCINRNTIVLIFCTTAYKDDNWIAIRQWLEENEIQFQVYESIYDPELGENILKILCDSLQKEAKEREEESKNKAKKTPVKYINIDSDSESDDDEKKPKKMAPEYLIIFDDLSDELQDKHIPQLMKKNRHYKSKVIVSSQWFHDLNKSARKQLDFILFFRDIPEEKLKVAYDELNLGKIDYEAFKKMYNHATKEPYNFLYIGTVNKKFRKNFDTMYEIPEIV